MTHWFRFLPALAGALAVAVCLSVVTPADVRAATSKAEAQDAGESLLVTITSDEKQVQGMALILSLEALKRGAEVRLLLCGPGGDIAVSGSRTPKLEPSGKTVQQLLQAAIAQGATANVCGLYLPNTHRVAGELIDGVTPAKPVDIGAVMARPEVRFFSY